MSRRSRLKLDGIPIHIIQRGNNRGRIPIFRVHFYYPKLPPVPPVAIHIKPFQGCGYSSPIFIDLCG
jgi:hypothetical protein